MTRGFLIAAMLVSPILVSSTPFRAPSYADTWVVRKDGTGDCTAIQPCIDSSGSGDTVLVGPGAYTSEWLSITDKSDLVLRSEAGPALTKLTADFFPCITCDNLSGQSVIEGFTFADCHTATGMGGAIFAGSSSLAIKGNVFYDCSAGGIEGGYGAGGAIYLYGSSGSVRQNTIVHCLAGEWWANGSGGGICLDGSQNVVVDRNIIAGCTGGGIWANGIPVISCNDVWDNWPVDYLGSITNQDGINGNISADPVFCDAVARNLALNSSSPCISAPGCGLMGALPMGCGDTPVRETTWGRLKTLFR